MYDTLLRRPPTVPYLHFAPSLTHWWHWGFQIVADWTDVSVHGRMAQRGGPKLAGPRKCFHLRWYLSTCGLFLQLLSARVYNAVGNSLGHFADGVRHAVAPTLNTPARTKLPNFQKMPTGHTLGATPLDLVYRLLVLYTRFENVREKLRWQLLPRVDV